MIVIGLTGSIGMGKSTTARLFAEFGARVWDADAAVHRLYAPGGPGVSVVKALVPEAVQGDMVDRRILRERVTERPDLLAHLEAGIHPLVQHDRETFLRIAAEEGVDIAVCDIPLLFETGDPRAFDAVVVVSAPPAIQRARVLARPAMTEESFARILARQMPDPEKRARADFIVDTSTGIERARQTVKTIIATMKDAKSHA